MDGVTGMMEGTRSHYEKAVSLGYTFRSFDNAHLLDREVPILYDISMESFRDNFLFEPIPFEMFRALYVPAANKVDMSLSHFVCDPNGKEVGFFFGFPSTQGEKSLVIKTIALLPETRGLGLSNALFHSVTREADSRGICRSIGALMKSGIQSESYTRKQKILWRNSYALFGKDL